MEHTASRPLGAVSTELRQFRLIASPCRSVLAADCDPLRRSKVPAEDSHLSPLEKAKSCIPSGVC